MRWTKPLLLAGALAAPLFIATDLFAATLLYPGYDYTSQQVSELSAIGAPTRTFWLAMGYPYSLLLLALAAGTWLSATRTAQRVVAILIALFTAHSFAWALFAPMHMRGTEFGDTDTAHIAFTVVAVLLMTGFITSGALLFGRGFRLYSALTIVAMLASGGIVGTQISAIAAGEPTPWMGLVERIAVYGPIVWTAVFALALWSRAEEAASPP